jgi:DNA-binding NtrC family response regulator
LNIQRILIIEDDIALCRFMEAHFKKRGFHPSSANCLSDARQALAEDSFDLIISDIRFPDGDGIEFLKSIRQENKSILHITMTGYGSISSAVESIRHGSSDYLVKPFTGEQLDVALERLESWKRLANENAYLRREQDEKEGPQHLLGNSEGMNKLKALIERVASTKATVLIQGESGTGKELVARAIWMASTRKDAPFIKLNCAAVPENLMESELFGHEKGAFTGALNRRDGRFQMADGGTLLLDEISEIPLALQAKLLRVLQESEFERVGGNKTVKVDVRILATTNRNLKTSVEKGEFREDLFYRLNVFPIQVPPLRERTGDVQLLVNHYVEFFAKQYGKTLPPIEPDTMATLASNAWKGNVRELQNAAARAVILGEPNRKIIPEDFGISASTSSSETVTPIPVPAPAPQRGATPIPEPVVISSVNSAPSEDGSIERLDQMEKKMIEKTLIQTKGNKTHAAKLLGISVRTLRNKLHEYRLAGAEDDEAGNGSDDASKATVGSP